MFDPSRILPLVRERHSLPPENPAPFVGIASLRVAGFRIGSNQESVVTRIGQQIIVTVHHSLVSALVDKYVSRECGHYEPGVLVVKLVELATKLTDVFYANRNSKPIPHWYAAKELCLFLQHGEGVPNPGEVMMYTEDLSNSMTTTKKLFDDLLAAGIAFVD